MLCTAPSLRTAAIGCRIQPTLFTPCTSSLQLQTRAATTATQSPLQSQQSSPAPTNSELLNWNDYFRLRRQRRFWQLGSSIGTSLNGFAGGAYILTSTDMDALVSQIPLDPFVTFGLITFASGGAGWLAGPILGTAMFNWRVGKNRKQQMELKEKEFYRRVKKYRVDPSGGSAANPVPDYYGEKIASVAGYRQWLKDQRAFNKKRHTYI